MTNIVSYHGFTGNNPINRFEVLLDFSKPPLLDSESFVSSPTQNNSNLNVSGERDAWVASISDAVLGILNSKRNKRPWGHREFIYDVGLFIFGAPFGLYLCWQSSNVIENNFAGGSTFLIAAAYIYAFLFALMGYRVLFGYMKWAFPLNEIEESSDNAAHHRKFWYLIIVGLCGKFLWDIFR